jgi:hypothetical protein
MKRQKTPYLKREGQSASSIATDEASSAVSASLESMMLIFMMLQMQQQ